MNIIFSILKRDLKWKLIQIDIQVKKLKMISSAFNSKWGDMNFIFKKSKDDGKNINNA